LLIKNMDELKKTIENALKNMGCEDITFNVAQENYMQVIFNCKEITSFVTKIPGWSDSGIQLNTTNGHQYKIEFHKI
jgi:hypothetical protein